MDQIINAFKLAIQENYVNFSGRANQGEFWYFYLGYLIIAVIFNIIGMILPDSLATIVSLIPAITLIVPVLSAATRRLHDINKSGWFILVPFYNIYLWAQPGDQGPNQYGEPSKNLQ
ncbi:MAG: DUF805 domain-containing protein [Negativicutes bacterium]|jgi:uncharacterized membrane protein YhaH (DUF805 family)|nr:DUF805 domain-containing protein [Negativicutes bacterium]